jgi:hypothetical protein
MAESRVLAFNNNPAQMQLFHEVEACPLCGSDFRQHHSQPGRNLYSEKLAAHLGTDEDELLASVINVECQQCHLIYKQRWFPASLLQTLFAESVPSHPRGWDVQSGRFSAANVQAEVEAYAVALRDRKQDQIRRYQRALASIILAIPALDHSPSRDPLLHAIESGDIKLLREADDLLRSVMVEPRPYSRFAGFSSSELWHYLVSKLGSLSSYAEIGCPLWGLLPLAQTKGCRTAFLQRQEPNYWAAGCQVNAVHCSQHLHSQIGIPLLDWQEPFADPFEAIGSFLYLDHLNDPAAFIEALLTKSRAIAIILDALDLPLAIQHFTGWPEPAMDWLAARTGCQLHSDFESIKHSDFNLYLLVR